MVYIVLIYEEGLIVMCYVRGNGLGVELDLELKNILIGIWDVLKEGLDIIILMFGIMILMVMDVVVEFEK